MLITDLLRLEVLTLARGISMEEWKKMNNFKDEEKEPPKQNYKSNHSQKKTSPQKNQRQQNFNSNKPVKHFSATATAPYNFVALPEKILPAPVADVESYKAQIETAELFSGEIELEIESLTPLFIGGNDEKTFAPVTEIIPGSSLRGMFKNIFKIVTCSAFRGRTSTQKKGEDFNDEHIYYRCLMKNNRVAWDNGYNWSKDLHDLYSDRMTSTRDKKPVKNARPGFLIQTADGKFYIAPSTYRTDRKDDKIFITEYEKEFNEPVKIRGDSKVVWHGREAYILTGSQPAFKLHDKESYERLNDDEKKKAGKQQIRFTKIDYVDWSREHWLELPDDVRESYEHDRNRKGVNLFKDSGILKRDKIFELAPNAPAEIERLVPCHFLEEGGEVTAFGHGQCFRIPYKNAIGDAVEENLQSDIVDFADAVFGRESFWSSRVAFEDAKIISTAGTLPTAAAHPLMQPNPTSYQLYLKQEDKNSLSHWDSRNAELRGYKLYWHDKFCDWQANDAEKKLDADKPKNKRMTKDLTPLKAGNKFKSKVRFENLTKIELGALLMIFDLNGAKNPAYKIGMGKPLGLGSIKVVPKLFVESETAYTELFEGDSFKNPCREENFAEYLNAFKNYVEKCNLKSAWEKVMRELNSMLDWDNTQKNNWHEKVKSMSGNVQKGDVDDRFVKRIPLPAISEVVK